MPALDKTEEGISCSLLLTVLLYIIVIYLLGVNCNFTVGSSRGNHVL